MSSIKPSTQHLSNYQKQQYTLYLETQLEKFSAFMLTQKKDNERTKFLEETIQNMSKNIGDLNDRIKMLEYYQKENFNQCQRIQNQNAKAADLDHRLKKVESIYFQRPIQGKNKENMMNVGNYAQRSDRQIQEIASFVENFSQTMNKKIKNLEKQIKNLYSLNQRNNQTVRAHTTKSRQSQPITTNYSEINSVHTSNHPQSSNNYYYTDKGVTKNELKQTENKLFDVFDQKFSKIEKMIRKSIKSKNKSKSPKNSLDVSRPNSQNLMIKEQTFAISNQSPMDDHLGYYHKSQQNFAYHEKQLDDQYQIGHYNIKNSVHEGSYSISDTSQRLKPVTQQNGMKKSKQSSKEQNKKSKVSEKNRKDLKSISQSKSRSKSKSVKKEMKKKVTNLAKRLKQNEDKKSSRLSPYQSTKTNKQHEKSKSVSRSKSKSHKRQNSKSRSISKSRSKSAKGSKTPQQLSPRSKNQTKKMQFLSTKEYRMNCIKNHNI